MARFTWTSYTFRAPTSISEFEYRTIKISPSVYRGGTKIYLREFRHRAILEHRFQILSAVILLPIGLALALVMPPLGALVGILVVFLGMSLLMTFGSLSIFMLKYRTYFNRVARIGEKAESYDQFLREVKGER